MSQKGYKKQLVCDGISYADRTEFVLINEKINNMQYIGKIVKQQVPSFFARIAAQRHPTVEQYETTNMLWLLFTRDC